MRLGITGHRGLPEAVERQVRALLTETVGGYASADLVGLSCLADGPDSWFAQTILDHGGQLEAVLPAEQYRADLPDWHHPTFDALLARAGRTHRTGLDSSGSDAHMAGSELLVDQADELLAVWDGLPARGYGGTADVVAYARQKGVPVRIIWPEGATRD
ncbi:hypothetical protein LK07_17995 [Streptomyces pluripotens]|uniref:DUF1273 domain-containing protein n=1 Tax=Streptomyces pluripotens TaxID=1355015 RepID=A0A221P0D4_9ACTN|nr:hypothetical protein [Streptomyces pluripotens]ARP71352.1 hypothetical protein LK06_016840 [Streptomyces pluripotens]ASN25604.1 hypothetical protein LK07_17995 [Streptomyces pluripotens]